MSGAALREVETYDIPASVAFSAGLANIARSSKVLAEKVNHLVEDVQFTVATRTMKGEPIQKQLGRITRENFADFRPRQDTQQKAIDKLEAEGCRLVRRGRFAVTMSGSAPLVESLIGQKLVVQGRARQSHHRSTLMFATDFEAPLPHDLFLAPATSLSVGSAVSENVDHLVFIPPPVYFSAPSPHAPSHGFHAVDEARIHGFSQRWSAKCRGWLRPGGRSRSLGANIGSARRLSLEVPVCAISC